MSSKLLILDYFGLLCWVELVPSKFTSIIATLDTLIINLIREIGVDNLGLILG